MILPYRRAQPRPVRCNFPKRHFYVKWICEVRHYGVSWVLSGFRLAQLPYAIGVRSHGVESYLCFDELSLTHER